MITIGNITNQARLGVGNSRTVINKLLLENEELKNDLIRKETSLMISSFELSRRKEMITTIEELTTHVEQLETENQRLVDDVKKLESTISLLTLKLDQKNAVLQDISLKNLLPAGRQPGELSAALQSISKIIEREQEKEKLLDEAETLASEWQNEYFRNIKRQFPQLTFTDLKICTLLKKKLSTKEIARVINLTVRGVEASRYRIRKKLNVSSTTDLSEFLNAL